MVQQTRFVVELDKKLLHSSFLLCYTHSSVTDDARQQQEKSMTIYILQATRNDQWFDHVFIFTTEESAKKFAIKMDLEDYQIYPQIVND